MVGTLNGELKELFIKRKNLCYAFTKINGRGIYTMYEKIKNDIAQEYYVKNYPNDGQRFVAWYLRKIQD